MNDIYNYILKFANTLERDGLRLSTVADLDPFRSELIFQTCGIKSINGIQFQILIRSLIFTET